MLEASKGWSNPSQPPSVPHDDRGHRDFYEGPFLKMLLDRLAHLLDQVVAVVQQ